MARPRMVTRTMKELKVDVICLNLETRESFNKEFILTGDYTEDKLIKELRKNYETETEKLVQIIGIKREQTLYGMPETEFIKNAEKIEKEN